MSEMEDALETRRQLSLAAAQGNVTAWHRLGYMLGFDAAQGDDNAGSGAAPRASTPRASTPRTRAGKRNLTPGPRGTTPRKKLQEMQQSPHLQ